MGTQALGGGVGRVGELGVCGVDCGRGDNLVIAPGSLIAPGRYIVGLGFFQRLDSWLDWRLAWVTGKGNTNPCIYSPLICYCANA